MAESLSSILKHIGSPAMMNLILVTLLTTIALLAYQGFFPACDPKPESYRFYILLCLAASFFYIFTMIISSMYRGFFDRRLSDYEYEMLQMIGRGELESKDVRGIPEQATLVVLSEKGFVDCHRFGKFLYLTEKGVKRANKPR